jgi:hypothetical protein
VPKDPPGQAEGPQMGCADASVEAGGWYGHAAPRKRVILVDVTYELRAGDVRHFFACDKGVLMAEGGGLRSCAVG